MRALTIGTIKALVKWRIPFLLAGIVAVVMCVPLVLATSTGGEYLGRTWYATALQQLESTYNQGAYEGAPDYIQESARQEIELLTQATQGNEREFYAYLAQYEELLVDEMERGYLQTDANATYFAAALTQGLARLDNPVVFTSTADMGTLHYLSFVGTAIVPYYLWLVIALCTAAMAASLFSQTKLFSRSPVSTWRASLCGTAASTVVSLACCALAALPCCIVSFVRNGAGDGAYPVISIQNDVVVCSTLGAELVKLAIALLLCTLFVCAATCSLHALTGSVPATVAVLGVLVLSSSFGALYSDDLPDLWQRVFACTPLAYFNPVRYVGYPVYFCNAPLSPNPYVTFSRLVPVLGVSTLVVAALPLVKRLGAQQAKPGAATVPNGVLAVADLRARFGAKKVVADRLDAAFAPGGVYGLVAPNGYGKTTLLQCISGCPACRMDGSVQCGPVASTRESSYRRLVIYMGAESQALYPMLTVRDHLLLGTTLWKSDQDPGDIATRYGLTPYLKVPVRKLSQGMRQALSLAVAHASGVPVLVLDEPMNALDRTNVLRCAENIRSMTASGRTVLLSSHLLENLDDLCPNTTLFLVEGKLVAKPDPSASVASTYQYLYM
jgi:ABC-2 type transport system ATP-binding protein